jgi:periplasmic protein TonB
LHVLAVLGLISAFSPGLAGMAMPGGLLSRFVHEPPPKSKPPPPPAKPRQHSGGAPHVAGKKAIAAPVMAITPVRPPEPIAAASHPADGAANQSGAALTSAGNGGGGSGSGSGVGQGADNGGGTPLRQIDGAIREQDYPREAERLHQSGRVHIRFTVGVNGRVSDCRVTRSSGSPSLDEATCRLILKRFRYEPSRDAAGRAFADVVTGVHHWRIGGSVEDDAPDDAGN